MLIGKTQTRQATIRDLSSGVILTFTYEPPSAEQVVQLQAKTFRAEAGPDGKPSISLNRAGAGLELMAPLVKSFEPAEGSEPLEVEVEDGGMAPLSSREGDPGYRADWYALLVAGLPSVMLALVNEVFGLGAIKVDAPEGPRPN